MKIFDIFSKRQKRSQGEVPDVYNTRIFPMHYGFRLSIFLKKLGIYVAKCRFQKL